MGILKYIHMYVHRKRRYFQRQQVAKVHFFSLLKKGRRPRVKFQLNHGRRNEAEATSFSVKNNNSNNNKSVQQKRDLTFKV